MKKLSLFAIAIFIFSLSFFYYLYFLPYGISMLGEGYYAYGAKQVMEGKVLFRDFVSFGHAPGQFYLPGFFMKMFGFNIFVERLYYLLIGSLLAVVIFLITLKITNKISFSLASSLLYIFFTSLKNERLLFPYIAILFAIIFDLFNFKNNKKIYWHSFMIGFLVGFSTMVSQEYGAALFVSVFFFILYRIYTARVNLNKISMKKNIFYHLLFFVMGILVVILPIIYFFYKNDAIKQFFYYLVYYPLAVYPKTMGFSPPDIIFYFKDFIKLQSLHALVYLVNTLFLYLVFFYLLVIYILSFKRFKESFKNNCEGDYSCLILLVFGLISFMRTIARFELPDLLQTMIPAIMLSGPILRDIYLKIKSNFGKRILTFFCIFILFILMIYGQLVINFILNSQESNFLILKNKAQYGKLNLDRAKDIYSRTTPAEDIRNTVLFIENNTRKGDYIFAVPYESMFYFLTDRDTPVKYPVFLPGHHDTEDQIDIINTLEKNKPKFIIYGHGWPLDNVLFSEYAPLVHDYIITNCTIREKFGIYFVYSCF
ncbi:MAG: hypothetical protein V1660_04645 [archaeon]